MLVPARTDTRWFHNYVYMKDNTEIIFIKGRLHYNDGPRPAAFPSMLVFFNLEPININE